MKSKIYKQHQDWGYTLINLVESIIIGFFLYNAYGGSYEFLLAVPLVVAYATILYIHYHSFSFKLVQIGELETPDMPIVNYYFMIMKDLETFYISIMGALIGIWVILHIDEGMICILKTPAFLYLIADIPVTLFVGRCRKYYLKLKLLNLKKIKTTDHDFLIKRKITDADKKIISIKNYFKVEKSGSDL